MKPTDRAPIAAELPVALKDAHFLPVAMNGQKTLKCERTGTVFFLTPVLECNRDTAAQPLMDQGFEKVSLPEVPLFNPGFVRELLHAVPKRLRRR